MTTLSPKPNGGEPGGDRSPLSIFAALAATGAFLVAALAVVITVVKDPGVGGGSVKTAAGSSVSVTMTEFKIAPAVITVPPGPVKLVVANAGTQVHNLQVKGVNKATSNIAAAASETLDLGDVKAGTYEVICTIPGHADSGMKATLKVEEGATASAAAASEPSAGHTTDTALPADSDQQMIDGANAYVKAVVGSLTEGKPNPTSNGGKGAQGVATKGRGNQKMEAKVLPDGTKEFDLEAKIIDWETEPGKTVKAWAYNEQVPGPWIRVEPGDKVKVVLKNSLPIGTDIHFHGVSTPFKSDGVAPITQDMVKSGATYNYEFTAPNRSELGMYHAHNHGHVSIVNGLFAIFQVGDVPLPTGRTITGVTVPNNLKPQQELAMVVNDAGVIGLSLNGKAFPATDPIITSEGDWTELHYYNEGLVAHPMHLHHIPQLVVAKDGIPLDSPYWMDTLNVAPGERYTVLVQSRRDDIDLSNPAKPGPGIWAFHCHILNHAENDKGLFGMVTAWVVLPKA